MRTVKMIAEESDRNADIERVVCVKARWSESRQVAGRVTVTEG